MYSATLIPATKPGYTLWKKDEDYPDTFGVIVGYVIAFCMTNTYNLVVYYVTQEGKIGYSDIQTLEKDDIRMLPIENY